MIFLLFLCFSLSEQAKNPEKSYYKKKADADLMPNYVDITPFDTLETLERKAKEAEIAAANEKFKYYKGMNEANSSLIDKVFQKKIIRGHSSENRTSSEIKCVNCLRENLKRKNFNTEHYASSERCPVTNAKIRTQKKLNTSYEPNELNRNHLQKFQKRKNYRSNQYLIQLCLSQINQIKNSKAIAMQRTSK